ISHDVLSVSLSAPRPTRVERGRTTCTRGDRVSNKTTWRKRALGVTAGVGAAAMVLAGCSTTPPAEEEPTTVDTAVTIAEVNEFTSTNSISATGNLDINGKVNYLTRAGFYYVSDEYE